MKVLILGSGAREHAMAWKLSRERDVSDVLCAPGNPGIAAVAQCIPADLAKPPQLLAIAQSQDVDLTVVGPELPLSLGVADLFAEAGRAIVGPVSRRSSTGVQQVVREGVHGTPSRAHRPISRL
jgi:phosphoribosylamine--glycine ligase